jgi:hypothetical protein
MNNKQFEFDPAFNPDNLTEMTVKTNTGIMEQYHVPRINLNTATCAFSMNLSAMSLMGLKRDNINKITFLKDGSYLYINPMPKQDNKNTLIVSPKSNSFGSRAIVVQMLEWFKLDREKAYKIKFKLTKKADYAFQLSIIHKKEIDRNKFKNPIN